MPKSSRLNNSRARMPSVASACEHSRPCHLSMSQMYSWLVLAMAPGFAGNTEERKSPNVRSQRCALCIRLKELRDSMKAVSRAESDSESGRIVVPPVECGQSRLGCRCAEAAVDRHPE